MTGPTPGRVLALAVAAWGLGDLAMGRTRVGAAWLVAEALLLLAVVVATLLWVDTSWYLIPFLLGTLFVGAWAWQAVAAYHGAQHRDGAVAPAPAGSPALAIAWLALPLLLWGTGFWLVAAGAATPGAVVDRFVAGWTDAADGDGGAFADLGDDPGALRREAERALDRLRELCADGSLPGDCATAPENLLRDVRLQVQRDDGVSAVVVADLVRYLERPTRFLGLFDTSELVPFPTERILRLELEAREAPLGARRWTIVNAEAG